MEIESGARERPLYGIFCMMLQGPCSEPTHVSGGVRIFTMGLRNRVRVVRKGDDEKFGGERCVNSGGALG